LNNKNIKIEITSGLLGDTNNLCNLYEGTLVNHNHETLIYKIADINLLNPNVPPTLREVNQIEESFYNRTLNNSLLIVLMNIPVGGIYYYPQNKINDEWQPKIPWGFYELSTTSRKKIGVNMYDPKSIYYNYLLALPLCKIQGTSTYFLLPQATEIVTATESYRLVPIIKYNNNILPRK
jgi:hypothetical protein